MEEDLVKLSYWVSMLKQETECSICLHTLRDPVTTRCFHTFCKRCISRVLKSKKTCACPLCNTVINRRGAEANTKIRVFIDKINPIIDVVKNGSCVDILSYHKGKSITTLLDCLPSQNDFTAEPASEINEVLSGEVTFNNNGAKNFSSTLNLVKTQDTRLKNSEKVTDIEDGLLIGAKSNPHEMRPNSLCDINISSNGEEQNLNYNEHLIAVDHLSVSQNICQRTNLRKTSSIKIPLAENVKSPAKKVKEWLSENVVEGSSSQFISESDPCSPCVETKTAIENYEFVKEKVVTEKEMIGVPQTEFDLSKSFVGRLSKKVYKGSKKSEEELQKRAMCSYSGNVWRKVEDPSSLTIEEKGSIPDSCPVEMNDTFDKLVCEAREAESTKPISSPEKEDFEDRSGIGLFESLPMPSESDNCKRKCHSNVIKSEGNKISSSRHKSGSNENSSKMHKKRKYFHENEEKTSTKLLKDDISAGSSSMKEQIIHGFDNNVIVVGSVSKGRNVTVHQENNVSANEKSSSKTGSKSNTYKNIVLSKNTPTSKKKRLDLGLSSPGWSHLSSVRKDFQDPKKGMLPALNVSGGDPCLVNRSHCSKNVIKSYEALGVKPLSSPVCIDDAESNQTQSVAPKDPVISPKNSSMENINTSKHSCSKLKERLKTSEVDCSFSEIFHYSRKMSTPQAGSNTKMDSIGVSKNCEETEICEKENFVESCSTKNIFKDLQNQSLAAHCAKSPSSGNKIISKLSTPIVVERKTFSLSSSTQDLNELVDNIQRNSTGDQLKILANSSIQKYKDDKNDKDFGSKTTFMEQKEEINFDAVGTGLDSRRKLHIKSKDIQDYTSLSNDNPLSLKGKAKHGKNPSAASKLVMPILKLGRLKERKHLISSRVKFFILGKVRHYDGAVKNTSEVSVVTDSLTPLQKGRLSDAKTFCSRNSKEIGIQTSISSLKKPQCCLHEECQLPVDHESLKDVPGISHHRSDKRLRNKREYASSRVMSPEKDKAEGEISLIAEADGIHLSLAKETQRVERDGAQSNHHSNDISQDKLSSMYAEEQGKSESQTSGDLVELIPNTERSGPKILLANRFKNSRNRSYVPSHKNLISRSYYQSLNSRKGSLSGRKPVCQLFTANALDESCKLDKEIASPIIYTQTSGSHKNKSIEPESSSRSKSPKVISISSDDSSSDYEDINRNHKKIISKSTFSQNKAISSNKEDRSIKEHMTETGSTGTKPCLRSIEIGSSDDSQKEIGGKLEQILANVEADLNVRRNRKIISADDDKTGEQSCKTLKSGLMLHSLPKTPALTPSFVEESDLSENESCDKIAMSKKEHCVHENSPTVVDLLKESSGEESDCIVEASQKTDNYLEKSVSKKGPISLVASGLTTQEVTRVKIFAQLFNLYFSPQFCGKRNENFPSTSHVVTKGDSDGKTICTFKYLCGVITGCWIVSVKWVMDCLSADQLLDEEPYEISDASGSKVSSRGRHAAQKLFAGFEFIYKEPFTDLTGEQLKEIIQLGGGKVVSNVEEFSSCKGKHLAIADSASIDSNADFCNLMKHHDIAVVACEWMVESIEEYRILSLLNYVLNIDAESSHIKVFEKLLKMGYTEDLVKIDDEPIENTEQFDETIDEGPSDG